ncbi:MAG: adenosine kinase [Pelagibacterales bacterium]|nr:adenosine kinase [Pelagibacterales bacterium]
MKIIGIGNAIIDVLGRVDDTFIKKNQLSKGSMKLISQTELEKLLSTIKIEKKIAGGSVANSMVGLSHLGNEVGFIGKINDDDLGENYEKDLNNQKVTFCYKKKREIMPTGTCVVLITPDNERTMCTFLGASAIISEKDIDEDLIKNSEMSILEGYLWDSNESKLAFKKIIKNSKKKVMTLSDKFCVERHRTDFLNLVKNYLDIVFANENEILTLFETDNLKKIINFCKALKKIIVITKSNKGSLVIFGDTVEECSAKQNLKIIDLTGAGDLFLAGFISNYRRNKNLKECLNLGTEMASKIIQKVGARL